MTAADQADERITTAEKVAFLSRAETYGPYIEGVEVKETHMSWLFLAGKRVYKMKKPVRYPYLDFRSLEARKANCHTETRLNRRLAPDVYRGVARLTRDNSGALALDGEGETVEWLVVMRRLPEERMLDHVLQHGTVTRREIERVADMLGQFYARLESVDIAVTEHVDMFVRQHRTNRELLGEPRSGVAGPLLDTVLARIDGFLEQDTGLIAARVRSGHIIEGHGDLRPGHVCLCDPPVIIDCLEFNRVLRLLDPFDELADLALECERLGAAWIGPVLIERCAAELGDPPPGSLMAFYTAYRACLRARLAVRHLQDDEVAEPDKWPALAREYLEIAARASLSFPARAGRPASRSRGSGE